MILPEEARPHRKSVFNFHPPLNLRREPGLTFFGEQEFPLPYFGGCSKDKADNHDPDEKTHVFLGNVECIASRSQTAYPTHRGNKKRNIPPPLSYINSGSTGLLARCSVCRQYSCREEYMIAHDNKMKNAYHIPCTPTCSLLLGQPSSYIALGAIRTLSSGFTDGAVAQIFRGSALQGLLEDERLGRSVQPQNTFGQEDAPPIAYLLCRARVRRCNTVKARPGKRG